jgi:hypothetical protein
MGVVWLQGLVVGAEWSTEHDAGLEHFLLHLGICSLIFTWEIE